MAEKSTATKPEDMSWERWAAYLQRELARQEETLADLAAQNEELRERLRELEGE